MDKTYSLNNCLIKLRFSPGLIQLVSDLPLWIYLNRAVKLRTNRLIKEIKKDYVRRFNRPLAISDASLAVEIWAHVYCHYYALLLLKKNWLRPVHGLIKKVVERAEVVDCGEADQDGNRWIWNLLSAFNVGMVWLLPKRIPIAKLRRTFQGA